MWLDHKRSVLCVMVCAACREAAQFGQNVRHMHEWSHTPLCVLYIFMYIHIQVVCDKCYVKHTFAVKYL